MDIFIDVMLVLFLILGFIASVVLLTLGVILVIKEMRGKEVKRDEAEKVDSASDCSYDE